ncbi:hypothetical protein B296_00054570 [Ensete ventricosum]|uniref:Uncharacterized protein n=1 Tax=Ensete ventricosum TaxID=4639 RepID=A0A426Y3C0_ENSVE|nr:hypothetical protein B296_00054570 [Ensete ventricosum]
MTVDYSRLSFRNVTSGTSAWLRPGYGKKEREEAKKKEKEGEEEGDVYSRRTSGRRCGEPREVATSSRRSSPRRLLLF